MRFFMYALSLFFLLNELAAGQEEMRVSSDLCGEFEAFQQTDCQKQSSENCSKQFAQQNALKYEFSQQDLVERLLSCEPISAPPVEDKQSFFKGATQKANVLGNTAMEFLLSDEVSSSEPSAPPPSPPASPPSSVPSLPPVSLPGSPVFSSPSEKTGERVASSPLSLTPSTVRNPKTHEKEGEKKALSSPQLSSSPPQSKPKTPSKSFKRSKHFAKSLHNKSRHSLPKKHSAASTPSSHKQRK